MDNREELNRWPTLHKRWRFLVIALAVSVSVLLPLPAFSYLRLLVTPNGVNMSGIFSRDTGSVYWGVLSTPETNQIQFVLLLPATTNIDWDSDANWPAEGNDYCYVQIKSNGHQWKIENITDLKTNIQTVRFRDVTSNTTTNLNLESSRFWQLNDSGHATRLQAIDAATLARIAGQVKAEETNFQTPLENSGNK